MTDYISREAARKEVGRWIYFADRPRSWMNAIDKAVEIIEAIPAADVVEVVHGEWKWDNRCGLYACSECGALSPRENQDGEYIDCPAYCHECGAKMDGGLTMDRLTTHDPDRQLVVCRANYESWNAIYDRLALYEDTGLEPEKVQDMMTDWVVWKEAEAGGRLIVLPCKVGDPIYWVVINRRNFHGRVHKAIRPSALTWGNLETVIRNFGKTVFLTYKEAEAALGGVSDD